MSTLSWDCHGFETPWDLQFLKESVLQKNPNFVFLSEIFCKKDSVEKVKSSIGFDGAFTVDCRGHNGGLALLWRNNQEIMLLFYSTNHIDVLLRQKVGVSIDSWVSMVNQTSLKERIHGTSFVLCIVKCPYLGC